MWNDCGGGVDDIPALKKADIRKAHYGDTEAALNAADIVLLGPALKYFCEAVLTCRSITVRMKSCMVHAVSIATHNVLSFMLLALVWKFDFPPLKMLFIAMPNCFIDVITSENRVRSSLLPVNWSLSEILTTGIILGSYLAMSTVIFFWAVYETNFFSLNKTYMKFGLAVLLQVSSSNSAVIFVMRTGSLLPGCDILLYICVFYQLISTMLVVFGDQIIGWSCAGKIWLYNIVFYVPLYCIKFFNQRSTKGFLKSTL